MDLLLSWGADPEFRNRIGQSAIDIAVNVGDEGVVEKLREAKKTIVPKPVHARTIRYREDIPEDLVIRYVNVIGRGRC